MLDVESGSKTSVKKVVVRYEIISLLQKFNTVLCRFFFRINEFVAFRRKNTPFNLKSTRLLGYCFWILLYSKPKTQKNRRMKKNTQKAFFIALVFSCVTFAQTKGKQSISKSTNAITQTNQNQLSYNDFTEDNKRSFDETGYVKCTSVEMHERRMLREGNSQSNDAFEEWLAPQIEHVSSYGLNKKPTVHLKWP